MSTPRNRSRAIRNARHIGTPAPQVNPLAALEAQFSRLTEIRRQLTSAKELHKEHDRIVEELIPLFITQTPEGWTIKREITLGSRTHRLVPYFFNAAENRIKAKQWKSTCFETMTID
ncbi:MAG: hypothetical protein IMZ61_09130 [Planctomycetes bacterium]|nr:hypothetical protein [Planctomycetota bacterium]